MPDMTLNDVLVEDTFAEAFPMTATALVITADSMKWARQAALTMTGFGTSVIGCGAECGIDREEFPDETPDKRSGVRVLLFAMGADALAKQVQNRVGQCVLTSPGSACFSGIEAEQRVPLGERLRYFGDGHQISKRFGARRFWRIPVMDGEFVCDDEAGMVKSAVGGGNLIVQGRDAAGLLEACEQAVAAIARVPNAITPFPGGVVRSGSKVGSKYKALPASTNDAYCPTLRGVVATSLDDDANGALEIVIDGLDYEAVANAMRAGLASFIANGARLGVTRVGAGNYGGKLGPHHFRLLELIP